MGREREGGKGERGGEGGRARENEGHQHFQDKCMFVE